MAASNRTKVLCSARCSSTRYTVAIRTFLADKNASPSCCTSHRARTNGFAIESAISISRPGNIYTGWPHVASFNSITSTLGQKNDENLSTMISHVIFRSLLIGRGYIDGNSDFYGKERGRGSFSPTDYYNEYSPFYIFSRVIRILCISAFLN